MDNSIAKTIIISDVTKHIAKKYKITLEEARDIFYKSNTLINLEDDSTGLYGDSSLYVFSLFLKEVANNDNH